MQPGLSYTREATYIPRTNVANVVELLTFDGTPKNYEPWDTN